MTVMPEQIRYSARIVDPTAAAGPDDLRTVHLVETVDDLGTGTGHVLYLSGPGGVVRHTLSEFDAVPVRGDSDKSGGYIVELASPVRIDDTRFTGLTLPLSVEQHPTLTGASGPTVELACCVPQRDFTVGEADGMPAFQPVPANVGRALLGILLRQMIRLDAIWPQRFEVQPAEITRLYDAIELTIDALLQKMPGGSIPLPRLFVSNLLRWAAYHRAKTHHGDYGDHTEVRVPAAVLKPLATDLLVAAGLVEPGKRRYES